MNDGACSLVQQKPTCDCSETKYHGEKCDILNCIEAETCHHGFCDLDEVRQ